MGPGGVPVVEVRLEEWHKRSDLASLGVSRLGLGDSLTQGAELGRLRVRVNRSRTLPHEHPKVALTAALRATRASDLHVRSLRRGVLS